MGAENSGAFMRWSVDLRFSLLLFVTPFPCPGRHRMTFHTCPGNCRPQLYELSSVVDQKGLFVNIMVGICQKCRRTLLAAFEFIEAFGVSEPQRSVFEE